MLVVNWRFNETYTRLHERFTCPQPDKRWSGTVSQTLKTAQCVSRVAVRVVRCELPQDYITSDVRVSKPVIRFMQQQRRGAPRLFLFDVGFVRFSVHVFVEEIRRTRGTKTLDFKWSTSNSAHDDQSSIPMLAPVPRTQRMSCLADLESSCSTYRLLQKVGLFIRRPILVNYAAATKQPSATISILIRTNYSPGSGVHGMLG